MSYLIFNEPTQKKEKYSQTRKILLYKQITRARVTLNEVTLEFANNKSQHWEKEVLTEMHNI